MPKQKDVLKKIVALKRQSAEQRVRTVQNDVDRIETHIQALCASLQGIDTSSAGSDAVHLAQEHGYPPKLIADIRAAQAALAIRQTELHAAREALKHVFHSQERLNEAASKG
ncbi:MAG: hypothetical protein RLO80_03195 [Hyphomonas sp.]